MSIGRDLMRLEESEFGKITTEYDDAFFDIPFGNSTFQIHNFIINAAHTPERAYRAIGLGMRAKINALKEAYYNLKKEEIDMEELFAKVKTDQMNDFEKRRTVLEIERKEEIRRDIKKLINDALAELQEYYRVFKTLPRFTRQQFEAGEKKYFETRLNKMALGVQGPLESLDNMGVDISRTIGREVPQFPRISETLKLVE
jgi:hypothetical protein